jgi:hypothetical protein
VQFDGLGLTDQQGSEQSGKGHGNLRRRQCG